MRDSARSSTRRIGGLLALVLVALAGSTASAAPFIAPFYAGSYTLTDLGSVAGLPPLYGGATFKAGDPNTLIVGGAANDPTGAFYTMPVIRGGDGHIVGLGAASFYSEGAFNDGGLQYGPGGVLFYTRFPTNELGQIKPGSVATDKIIDLGPFGIGTSVGALAFVPPGQPGAGQLKIVSYNTGEWYSVEIAPDGSGTYDVVSATLEVTLGGPDPEGIVYVPIGSPLFTAPAILLSEFIAGVVVAYDVDANGDPILGTRREFVSGLEGAEGAVIDPLTGDFLFTTFGGGDRIIVVRGFVAPASVPEPGSILLLGAGLLGLVAVKRRRSH